MILLKIIGLVAGYLITIFAGEQFVKGVLKEFDLPEASGLKDAGKYIGYFERFIVITFVLVDQYSAIAFILTAKSIARFEILKERKFAEYYLVGTLGSTSFALALGLLLKFILL
ncbi:MAG: hypothetical protein ACE5OR_09985 [bacterium]